jgi:hypothetical protein
MKTGRDPSTSTGDNRGNGELLVFGAEESLLPSIQRRRSFLRSLCRLLFKSLSLSGAILAFFAMAPGARTQYLGPPQPPALAGSTLGASMRNAAAATHAQAEIVRKSANDWGRRANSGSYGAYFQQDFQTLQFQFQMLREQFKGLGVLALQLGRPRASNAVAELDAGLNIIAELFTFLAGQFQSGTLDRQTIVRTCRAFEDAVREWDRELKKSSSRIGLVW